VFPRVYKRAGGKCEECGVDFEVAIGKNAWGSPIYPSSEFHHVIPFS
jgi:hypothetical protein